MSANCQMTSRIAGYVDLVKTSKESRREDDPGKFGRSTFDTEAARMEWGEGDATGAALSTITGTVSDLTVGAGEEEFIRMKSQKSLALGAATGLAMEGLAGAAVGASMASSAADAVEFFECKIDGTMVSGRFSKVSFVEGDTVTVVVDLPSNDALPLVLAALRPADQKLWMAPHRSRGSGAHACFSVKLFVVLFLCMNLLLGGAFGLTDYFNDDIGSPDFRKFWMSLVAVFSFTMSAYYAVRFYRQWRPVAQEAESIFSAFGLSDPTAVSLPQEHKRYCQRRGIRWPYDTEGTWIYYVER